VDAVVVQAALPGLLAARKTLPAKLFYDDEGCRLFGEITRLPEYYPTRTELAMLAATAGELLADPPDGSALIEYGGSDETKALYLFDSHPQIEAYVPVDVAAAALVRLAKRLYRSRPGLGVHPVVADFLGPFALPCSVHSRPLIGFFPGSTIGNLDPAQARQFLARVRLSLAGGRFLVGVDLRKDPAILLPAYDDAQGTTAAFNRNLLHRLNREAGADFDPSAFAHRAVWNAGKSRIEMHLVSERRQLVHVAGRQIRFEPGETIHTENSHKYDVSEFAALAASSGWQSARAWTDPEKLFSLHLLTA
jgi:dimethylhistidine N-methyltransferase